MTSYIYFIQAQGNGPIKIGSTGDNPRKRMVKIQSDCPWPVRLLGAIEGTVSQEKQIHLVLSRYRTQGEWFEPSEIVMAAVETALQHGRPAPFEGQQQPSTAAHPLKRWREDSGLTQTEAGKLLGTSHVCISRWETGVFVPQRRHWRKIEEVTGVTSSDLIAHCWQEMESAQ